MKTRIYTLIITITVILTAVSCQNELPFDIKANPPKLVMNAMINADSLTNVLFLNFTGKGKASHVGGATAEIRINGQLAQSLRPLPSQTEGDLQCRFQISGKFVPGDIVRIDAFTDDGQYHVWSEVTVPQRPHEIINIDTLTVPLKRYYYTQDYLRYKISIEDRKNENNYYRLIVEKQIRAVVLDETIGDYTTQIYKRFSFISREDVVLTDGHPMNEEDESNGMFDTVENIYGVFDDSRFKNNSYTMTVYNFANFEGLSIDNVSSKVDIFIRLLSISETEYYYLKALNLIDSDSYDETMNDPIKYPSNVHNGTGIICISTETSKTIHIAHPQ